MKKNVRFLTIMIVVLGFMCGCSKDNDPTPIPTINGLSITVKDLSTGNIVPYASIQVYGSDDDRKNQCNALLKTQTNAYGEVKIPGLIVGETYYFYASSGGKTNSTNSLSKYYSTENESTTIWLSSCQLLFKNTKSDSYKFIAKNVTTGVSYTYTVSPYSEFRLYDAQTGVYSVSYEQVNGYLIYPTTGSFDYLAVNNDLCGIFTL